MVSGLLLKFRLMSEFLVIYLNHANIKKKYFLQLVLRVLTNSSTSDVAGCRRQSPTFSIFSQTIKTLLRSTRTSPCLTLPTRLVTFSSRSVCRNQSTENIKKKRLETHSQTWAPTSPQNLALSFFSRSGFGTGTLFDNIFNYMASQVGNIIDYLG